MLVDVSKWFRTARVFALLVALVCVAAPQRAQAILTLDWDSVNWNGGDLTESYDVDGIAGDDIRITITGSNFSNSNPNDTTDLNAGTGGQQTLFLEVNQPNRNNVVTVTIAFINPLGADRVKFTLFDVDADLSGVSDVGYQDVITNIVGRGRDGKARGPSSIAGAKSNTVSGSGTNRAITGKNVADANTTNGHAVIDFGLTTVTQVSFTWMNGTGSPSNPGNQHIAIGDIQFSKVPEVNPALAAGMVCGLSVLGRWAWRRRHPR